MMLVRDLKEILNKCDDNTPIHIVCNGFRGFSIDEIIKKEDSVIVHSDHLDEYIDEYSME